MASFYRSAKEIVAKSNFKPLVLLEIKLLAKPFFAHTHRAYTGMRRVFGDNFSMTSSKTRRDRASIKECWILKTDVESVEPDVGLGGLGKRTSVYHVLMYIIVQKG